MTKYGEKDPKAVRRGQLSGKARKKKAEEDAGTETKATGKAATTEAEPTVHSVNIPSMSAVTLVDDVTNESITIEKKELREQDLDQWKIRKFNGDILLREIRRAKPEIGDKVFNTQLSKEELAGLDLQANATISPELANNDGDFRSRPYRELNQNRDGRFAKRQKLDEKTPSTADILKRKIRWFEQFRAAADAQAKKYEKALKSLEGGETAEISELADADNMSAIEEVLDENISRSATYSRSEWRHREKSLLSHIHGLSEFYRQDLSGMSLYVNRGIKELRKLNDECATLLYFLSQKDVDMRGLEAWAIAKTAPGMHICQCSSCRPLETLDSETKRLYELARPMEESSGKGPESMRALRETNSAGASIPEPTFWDAEPLAMGRIIDTLESDAGRSSAAELHRKLTGDSNEETVKELEDRWNKRMTEIEAKQAAEEKEIRQKRDLLSWQVTDRISELEDMQNYGKRLRAYLKSWKRLQEDAMEERGEQPHEAFKRNPFPEDLQAKSLDVYATLPLAEKQQCLAETEMNVEVKIHELEQSADAARLKIKRYTGADSMNLADDEYIDFLNSDLDTDEWLKRRQEKIEQLPKALRTKLETDAAVKSILQPKKFKFLEPHEYQERYESWTDAERAQEQNVRPLFVARGEDGQHIDCSFTFDCAKAWTQRKGSNPEVVELDS